ncbi:MULTISPECIES: hypothetical protein [unclassified Streptomyces]|uniref:hypothetical protein n=1 Tax=unclassified Streptomyces TaxID=2593676 RepID=UPI0036E8626F
MILLKPLLRAMARAPAVWAIWMAARPTLLEAAEIRTVSPERTPARSTRPPYQAIQGQPGRPGPTPGVLMGALTPDFRYIPNDPNRPSPLPTLPSAPTFPGR